MPHASELVSAGLPAPERAASALTVADLQGVARLAIDAVLGVTDIVEDMHRNIASLSPIVGASPAGSARGIPGLVYGIVRGVTRAVGFGLDTALAGLAPLLAVDVPWSGREAMVAGLNGVLGDHLAASMNPLAIRMRLGQSGEPLDVGSPVLAARLAPRGGKLMVLVHGLGMNDLQWERQGHDHGAAAGRDLGYTPVYLHYNTGRHIFTNGREFAETLEHLLRDWPVPVTELVIVGHSMGGLVARSACHYATVEGHAWLGYLSKLVFLGTPHQGAPLERAGSWANALIGISPYTAPFARLGEIRSAGIRDLSHGYVTDEERDGGGAARARRGPVPLPAGVQCFAIAATSETVDRGAPLAGDGLVPVASALGQHEDAALALSIPARHRSVMYGLNHFDLLSRRAVYDQIETWLTSD